MKRSQQGFTLIELVVVVVLLGIVGAVATARFQDLSGAAAQAAVDGVAAELGSASAINYAAGQVPGGASAVPITGAAYDCTTATALLQQNALPSTDYALSDTIDCAAGGGAGTAGTCTVTYTRGTSTFTATANLICTG